MNEPVWCRACGAVGDDGRPPSCFCPAVVEDATTPDSLVAQARAGGRQSWALRLVRECRRPDARMVLEQVVRAGADEAELTDAAVHALGTIAAPESLPLMLGLLTDGGRHTIGVIRYLARVDDPGAADRLLDLADADDVRIATEAAFGTAWRGDRRITARLLDLIVVAPASVAAGPVILDTRAVEPLLALADPQAVPRLAQYLERATDVDALVALRLEDAGDHGPEAELERWQHMERRLGVTVSTQLNPGYDPAERQARIIAAARSEAGQVLRQLVRVLLSFDDPRAREAVAAASGALGVQLDPELFRPDDAVDVPPAECTVEAWTLDYAPGDPDHAGTRFGGQPSWRAAPTWPLNRHGGPMAFWAQFEIPWAPDKLAYLFVDTTEEALLEPLEESTALFVQPGGAPQVPWRGDATGPQVPDQVQRDGRFRPPWPHGFTARVPSLVPVMEPPTWPSGRFQAATPLNKIGGTPLAIQWEPELPSDAYRFLFQFTAYEAGFELGDVAECYGYVDTGTGDGLFHWDCH